MKCQRGKANRHSRQTKLVLMPIGKCLFKEIAMDFVRELLELEAFHTILFVTDQFPNI